MLETKLETAREAETQEIELNQVAILLREGDEVAVAKTRIGVGTVLALAGWNRIARQSNGSART